MQVVVVSSTIHWKSVSGYSHSICSFSLLILLMLLLPVNQLFGQKNLDYRIHQNSYSVNNPAATGLFYKHFAAFSAHDIIEPTINYNKGTLLYDYNIDKISSGIGINSSYSNFINVIDNFSVAVNYAYHLDLGEESCLSAGVSLGNRRIHVDEKHLIFEDQFPDGSSVSTQFYKSNESRLFANFGFMYNFKNLLVGVSVAERYLQPIRERSFFREDQWAVNMTASYDYNINDNLVITPGIFALRYAEREDRIDYSLLVNLKKRYWAGFTYSDESSAAIMIGLDIQGKYRIGTAYNKAINSKNSSGMDAIEIAVAVMIK